MSQSPLPMRSPMRSPTPSIQSENDSVQLTPRSKIKALLARLDDSDDVELLSRSKGVSLPAAVPPRITEELQLNSAKQDDSEEDEETIIVPKGRLAARLQAQTNRSTSPSSNRSEDNSSLHNSDDDQSDNAVVAPRTARARLFKKPKLAAFERDAMDVMEKSQSPAASITYSEDEAEFSPAGLEATTIERVVHDHTPSDENTKNNRFEALVEKKRAERLAREAAEETKRAEKQAAGKKSTSGPEMSEIDSDEDDSDSGVRLTQKTRPVRKAGKKAIEEMARETQRISRNMQLAHEAKTKKKITKESLLARFRPQAKPSPVSVPASSSTANSSTPNSDGECPTVTPQTSPEREQYWKAADVPVLVPETSNLEHPSDEELPSLEAAMAQPIDKGKARAHEKPLNEPRSVGQGPIMPVNVTTLPEMLPEIKSSHLKVLKQRPIRLLLPNNYGEEKSSDDELEIVKSKAFQVFDNLPKKQRSNEKSLLRLRAFAGLISPSRNRNVKNESNTTPREPANDLRARARRQAAAERAEKIEILRSKGVIIQTAEERQRDQMEVEDMLEKARQEVDELTRKEKDAAKKEARAKGEDIEESSEDEEYMEHEDEEDVDLSGSEDEENEDEEDEEDSDVEKANGLIDDAASESGSTDEEGDDDEEAEENRGEIGNNVLQGQALPGHDAQAIDSGRKRHIRRVVDDDDDEAADYETQQQRTQACSPVTLPLTATNAILNPFGPQIGLGDAPMGLTQAFAATMADSQFPAGSLQEDSLAQLRSMPSPDFPNLVADYIPQDTQLEEIEELDVDLHITQTQIEPDTLPQTVGPNFTQLSEMPDPTQDVGFEKSSPMPTRFVAAPVSTIDTVIIPKISSSAGASKRGRLLKRAKPTMVVFSDDELSDDDQLDDDDLDDEAADADEIDETAFSLMRQAAEKAQRKATKFDKGKSEAKEMFEEQAQESEDEYAGLGGASDDSEGEDDEEIREMMDESEVNVNERKIAAYFAEKEREENEAGVNKLFKDINSGALRRKRGAGADFDDLDDSDDEYQARQARKRREFARMRNALFESDSNIVKIAEDPKKMAFLRAIEDRDENDDLGLLDSMAGEDDNNMNSQDVIPDSQSENRPPGEHGSSFISGETLVVKRTSHFETRRGVLGPARKPATLADIRASVSFLTEEPDMMFSTKVGPSIFDASSDVEMEDDDGVAIESSLIGEPDVSERVNPRRTAARSTNSQFVDRLSLKRQESSNDSQAGGGNLAFADPRFSCDIATFKPPTLLRKATSSFTSLSGQDENGISLNNNAKKATMEPDVKGRGVGGGSKRSSVNYYARAAERKAALEKRLGKNHESGTNTTLLRRQSSSLSNLLGSSNAWD